CPLLGDSRDLSWGYGLASSVGAMPGGGEPGAVMRGRGSRITRVGLAVWTLCMGSGVRDPAVNFPLAAAVDDVDERRRANRAVAVSAAGLAVTGLVELVIALVSGSVALLGDALHNLSDVSTSVLVFIGF